MCFLLLLDFNLHSYKNVVEIKVQSFHLNCSDTVSSRKGSAKVESLKVLLRTVLCYFPQQKELDKLNYLEWTPNTLQVLF